MENHESSSSVSTWKRKLRDVQTLLSLIGAIGVVGGWIVYFRQLPDHLSAIEGSIGTVTASVRDIEKIIQTNKDRFEQHVIETSHRDSDIQGLKERVNSCCPLYTPRYR